METVATSSPKAPEGPNSKEIGKSTTQEIIVVILAVLLKPLAWVWMGGVLHILWGWFIVPLAPAVPHPGLWHCCGIAALVSLISGVAYRNNSEGEGTTTKIITALSSSFFTPAWALLVGLIAHWLM